MEKEGFITVGSEVAGTLDWSRNWGGDGGGTNDGLDFDVEMSAAKSGMDFGGALSSLGVIILGWGALFRSEAVGAAVTKWRSYQSTEMYHR